MILALILAAISVTPAYTNVNRAGGSKIMTNIEQWAPAVEAAIGQGGEGGVSTNAVSGIITNHVTSGYLCTIQAAQTKADAAETAAKAYAETKYQPKGAYATNASISNDFPIVTNAYTKAEADAWFINIGENYVFADFCIVWTNSLGEYIGVISCDTEGYAWFDGLAEQSISSYYLNVGNRNLNLFGEYEETINPCVQFVNDSGAVTNELKIAYIYDCTNAAEAVVETKVDYTTNNTQLVSTITNLAPSKAKGVSLRDPVRNCSWYAAVTNGVFYWMVEE